jgi:hypothetical protein
MKRYFLIIFISLLFISISLFSQSLTGYLWQLQNPTKALVSELIGFDTDIFTYMSVDLNSIETSALNGTYKITDDKIILKFETGKKKIYKMTWINVNKVILSNNQTCLTYVKFKTSEDYFMKYQQSSNKDKKCKFCSGTNLCPVCEGIGIFSASDYSSPCAACGATGKCYKCKK